MIRSVSLVAGVLLSAAPGLLAAPYHPATDENFPTRLLWGDTHLHTSLSADASSMGNLNLGPEAAYQFARGERVESHRGGPARLSRPLDFLVVSDHAEYLGVMPWALSDPQTRNPARFGGLFFQALLLGEQAPRAEGVPVDEIRRSAWQASLAAAEAANQPGQFTALLGYEWSSMPAGDNLHRVVLFRDGADQVRGHLPFSALDSQDPEQLWSALETYEAETGGRAMAIPHNGNVSNGRMFALSRFNGEPIDASYARQRARWEPVVEVTQIKGDGETHPALSPTDEFADFGLWDKGNLGGIALKDPAMLPYEYARSALGLGLQVGERTGVNPFAFGMIGSSDAHTSMATADDDNYWGKGTHDEPGNPGRADRLFQIFVGPGKPPLTAEQWGNYEPDADDVVVYNWEQLASGYAAVWATDNTREAIFDALERREVYATTGPRISVRLFAGWDFPDDLLQHPDWVREAYRRGVPMGAELRRQGRDQAPTLLIAAMKDPEGANLDRVQVVKGWLDEKGQRQEQVYDVVWSDGREPDGDGRLPPVGNTVDVATASYRNSIGAPQLQASWRDPDFAPEQPAFYYLRVLEIPTPRWVVYDEARLGVAFPEEARRIDQQRAYSSPVWYLP